MFDEIDTLIKEMKFEDSLSLIDKQLMKSYDLSVDEQRLEFDELSRLKNDVITSMVQMVEEELSTRKDNFRSTSGTTPAQLQPHTQQYEEGYLKFFETIENRIFPFKTIMAQKSRVDVLLQPNLITKNEDHIFTDLSEAGLYIDAPEYDGYDLIYLRGFANNNQIDVSSTVDGLNNILSGLVKDRKEEIIIHFPIKLDGISDSALFLALFASLHSVIWFTINVGNQLNQSLNIYWAFDDDTSTDLFKKVITKAKILKARPAEIKDTIDRISKNACTKDEDYINQFRSVIHILTEKEVPILLIGEMGVGKSRLAKIFHDESKRAGNFISVNCGEITDELAESRIFGIKKGTASSVDKRDGKIKAAEGGTLFFDEIDRSSKKLRDILLTFIETKKYSVVGSNEEVTADVRLIYGSNKDFHKLIREGTFESDFLGRINERILKIPPVRERIDDIPLLVYAVLDELNIEGKTNIDIADDLVSKLSAIVINGNFRDVRNYIKYGYYECKASDRFGIITEEHYKYYSPSEAYLGEEFNQLKNLIKYFMLNIETFKAHYNIPKENDFNMLDNFLMPILANLYEHEVYLEKDYKWKKKHASTIVGMGWRQGETSKLTEKANEYKKLSKLL